MKKPQIALLAMTMMAGGFIIGYGVRGAGKGPPAKPTVGESRRERTGTVADSAGGTLRSRNTETGASRNARGSGGISLEAKTGKVIGMKNPADRITEWVMELENMTADNALAYLNALDASDPEAKKMLEWQTLIRKWMALDPVACARHIASLPVEKKTQFAIDVAMNKWAETDPGAAADFIKTLEGTPLHDTALHSYIGRIGTSDLDSAIAMADHAWKDKPEKYNWMMERLHGEFRFANQGGDSRKFFASIPSQEGKEAAFGHVFYRLWNNSPDEAAEWLVSERSFASDAAVQRIVNLKNEAKAGSGDAWKAANFPADVAPPP